MQIKTLFFIIFSLIVQKITAQSLETKLMGKWKYDSTVANSKRIKNAGNPKSDYLQFSRDTLIIAQYGDKIAGKYVLNGNSFSFEPFKTDHKKFIFKITYLNQNQLIISDDSKNDLNMEVRLFLSKE